MRDGGAGTGAGEGAGEEEGEPHVVDGAWPGRRVPGQARSGACSSSRWRVFLVTIAIGILNGLDVVTFDRNQLLTHVHSGTLGWITLSLVAASTWFAGGIDRRLAWALAVIIPIYVAGFYLAIPWLRAVVGGALLLVILWLVVWAWGMYMGRRSLPALAIALGLTTFTYGAIIGVLRQIQLAGGPSVFPETADVVGAHASAMVFSYLILVAMGLLEWRVRGTTGLPRGGLVQLGALFAGGLVLSFTLLFLSGDALQAAGGIDLLVNIVAVGFFVFRVVPEALRTDWMAGAAAALRRRRRSTWSSPWRSSCTSSSSSSATRRSPRTRHRSRAS